MTYIRKFNENNYDEWFKLVTPNDLRFFVENHTAIKLSQKEIDYTDDILHSFRNSGEYSPWDTALKGPLEYDLINVSNLMGRSGYCWPLKRLPTHHNPNNILSNGYFKYEIMVNKFPDEWYVVQYTTKYNTQYNIKREYSLVDWFIVDGFEGLKILLDKLKSGPLSSKSIPYGIDDPQVGKF